MWNMTGDGALICSVDCFAHTSPHVGASLGLPATLTSPPRTRPPPPPSVFHPTRCYPHCSRALLSVACSPRPRRCGGGGHRATVHSRYQCLWRIILFIAFVRRACHFFVSLLPTYCCSLSRYWCSSVVRFCLCYLANWVMDEGWKQSSKNRSVKQCPE